MAGGHGAAGRKAKAAGISAPEPGPEPELDDILAEIERQRLFRIIEDLVLWENTTNEEVLQRAREEIWQSWRRTCAENAGHPRAKELFDRHKLPAFHDPFAGGGALPLEAQRLGLEATRATSTRGGAHQQGDDRNPAEVRRQAAGEPGGAQEINSALKTWSGAQGLAEDVRYYGQWMRDEAEKRIGHLYPEDRDHRANGEGTARLETARWARAHRHRVALGAHGEESRTRRFAKVDVPLASTFMLRTKPGKEVYVKPVIESGGYRFTVKVGKPKDPEAAKNGTKLSRGANFKCVMSGIPIAGDYIKAEGKAGRMGARSWRLSRTARLGRVYLPPTARMEAVALQAKPEWLPETPLPDDCA